MTDKNATEHRECPWIIVRDNKKAIANLCVANGCISLADHSFMASDENRRETRHGFHRISQTDGSNALTSRQSSCLFNGGISLAIRTLVNRYSVLENCGSRVVVQ